MGGIASPNGQASRPRYGQVTRAGNAIPRPSGPVNKLGGAFAGVGVPPAPPPTQSPPPTTQELETWLRPFVQEIKAAGAVERQRQLLEIVREHLGKDYVQALMGAFSFLPHLRMPTVKKPPVQAPGESADDQSKAAGEAVKAAVSEVPGDGPDAASVGAGVPPAAPAVPDLPAPAGGAAPEPAGSEGDVSAVVLAMMEAAADGDDDLVERLAEVGQNPDELEDIATEQGQPENGTARAFSAFLNRLHAVPIAGRKTFSAYGQRIPAKVFSAYVGHAFRTFASSSASWDFSPSKSGKPKAVNKATGATYYGSRAQAIQERAGKGDAEPDSPRPHPARERAKELARQREEARVPVRATLEAALTDPKSVQPSHLADLAHDLNNLDKLQRNELRDHVRRVTNTSAFGKRKAELVAALLDHVRAQAAHEAVIEEPAEEATTSTPEPEAAAPAPTPEPEPAPTASEAPEPAPAPTPEPETTAPAAAEQAAEQQPNGNQSATEAPPEPQAGTTVTPEPEAKPAPEQATETAAEQATETAAEQATETAAEQATERPAEQPAPPAAEPAAPAPTPAPQHRSATAEAEHIATNPPPAPPAARAAEIRAAKQRQAAELRESRKKAVEKRGTGGILPPANAAPEAATPAGVNQSDVARLRENVGKLEGKVAGVTQAGNGQVYVLPESADHLRAAGVEVGPDGLVSAESVRNAVPQLKSAGVRLIAPKGAIPAAAESTTPGKQPHEMTREEWEAGRKAAAEKWHRENPRSTRANPPGWGSSHLHDISDALKTGKAVPDDIRRQYPHLLEPHEMSKDQFNKYYDQLMAQSGPRGPKASDQSVSGTWGEQSRRSHVLTALASGKSVPPEVLKDYPDLAAQYAPPASEQPAATPAPAAEPTPAPAEPAPASAPTPASIAPPLAQSVLPAKSVDLSKIDPRDYTASNFLPNRLPTTAKDGTFVPAGSGFVRKEGGKWVGYSKADADQSIMAARQPAGTAPPAPSAPAPAPVPPPAPIPPPPPPPSPEKISGTGVDAGTVKPDTTGVGQQPAAPATTGGNKMTAQEMFQAQQEKGKEASNLREKHYNSQIPPAGTFASEKQADYYRSVQGQATKTPTLAMSPTANPRQAATEVSQWFMGNLIPPPTNRGEVSAAIEAFKYPSLWVKANRAKVEGDIKRFSEIIGPDGSGLQKAIEAQQAALPEAERRASYNNPSAFEMYVLRPIFFGENK